MKTTLVSFPLRIAELAESARTLVMLDLFVGLRSTGSLELSYGARVAHSPHRRQRRRFSALSTSSLLADSQFALSIRGKRFGSVRFGTLRFDFCAALGSVTLASVGLLCEMAM